MLRIHASYHKCLTMYFIRIMNNALNRPWFWKKARYRHFESIEGVFYNDNHKYRLCSINGFAPDLKRLQDDFRMTRFVRDPRDLVISGYFYHKRGAEPWFRMKNPTDKYWEPINGKVPEGLSSDLSYAEYLSSLDKEAGLLAEIEFRRYHLESYREWEDDERILLLRYEDILGNEVETFGKIAEHLQFSVLEKKAIVALARHFAYRPAKKHGKHVRNPQPGQWREHFSPELAAFFNQHYHDILDRYNYTT